MPNIVFFLADDLRPDGLHSLGNKIVKTPNLDRLVERGFIFRYDIYPTICALAGVAVPAGLDAKSLLPVIQGKQPTVRDYAFTAYRDVQRAVRSDRWKLIRYPHIDKTQLFDLTADPHEMRDLSALREHAGRVLEMMKLLAQQQKLYGDACPLTVANPKKPDWSPEVRQAFRPDSRLGFPA
jgi:arylsulfatase A-like enzyme